MKKWLLFFLVFVMMPIAYAELCYQEDFDTPDLSGTDGNCALNYGGNNTYTGSWFYYSKMYDGLWGSGNFGYTSVTSTYFETYELPDDDLFGAYIYYGDDPNDLSHYHNISAENCSLNTIPNLNIKFLVSPQAGDKYVKSYCHNGSEYVLLGSHTDLIWIREVGIYWDVMTDVPNQIENITHLSNTSTSVEINWNWSDSCPNSSYGTKLYLNNELVTSLNCSYNSYNFTGLKSNTAYVFMGRAYNNSGTNYTDTINENYITLSTTIVPAGTFQLAFSNNVTGYTIEETHTWNFTNVNNLTTLLENASNGYIKLRFNNIDTDVYQKYDVEKTSSTAIDDTVTILNNSASNYTNFIVVGRDNSPITNTIVRTYQSNPSLNETWKLTNQILTDNYGLAEFAFEQDKPLKVEISDDTYEASVTFQDFKISIVDSSDPYKIFADFNDISTFSAINRIPYRYDNSSEDIFARVYAINVDNMSCNTQHRIGLSLASKRMTTGVTDDEGVYLTDGKVFLCQLTTGDFQTDTDIDLLLYYNEINYLNDTIFFDGTSRTNYFEIKDSGYDRDMIRVVAIIALLFIVVLSQFIFRSMQEDIGYHTYMAGSILVCIFDVTFGILVFFVAIAYIGGLFRKIIGIE